MDGVITTDIWTVLSRHLDDAMAADLSSFNAIQDLIHKGYVQLSPEEIGQNNQLYHTEMVVRLASMASKAMAAGGGIIFQCGESPLEGGLADVLTQKWRRFIEKLMDSIWMYGIAVIGKMEDEQVGAVPFVADITKAAVLVRRGFDGSPEYVVFSQALDEDGLPIVGITPERSWVREDNVFVFEVDTPTLLGSLTGVMSIVGSAKSDLEFILEAERVAYARNANPSVLLENTNPFDATVADFKDSGHPEHVAEDVNANEIREEISRIRGYLETANLLQQDRKDSMLNSVLSSSSLSALLTQASMPQQFFPKGYAVRASQQAHEPKHLMARMEAYETDVAALFYVPRSLWVTGHANKSSNNPDGRLLLRAGQKFLRERIVPLLSQLFSDIYTQHFHEIVNGDAGVVGKLSEQDGQSLSVIERHLKKGEEFKVVLAGLPSEDSIAAWTETRLMKRKAAAEILSSTYSIPLDYFNLEEPPEEVPTAAQRPAKRRKVGPESADSTGKSDNP